MAVIDLLKQDPKTPLTFEVYGDDALLWNSQPVTRYGQKQETGVIDINGVKELELRVVCPGDATGALAAWEPRIVRADAPDLAPLNFAHPPRSHDRSAPTANRVEAEKLLEEPEPVAESMQKLLSTAGHTEAVMSVAFSPDWETGGVGRTRWKAGGVGPR